MQYLFLIAAITLEVAATSLLALSDGFSKIIYGIASLVLYGLSVFTLSKALISIELGVAYATWCSVGMVLTSVIAVIFFGQRFTPIGVVSVVLIMAGCVVLNLFGTVK